MSHPALRGTIAGLLIGFVIGGVVCTKAFPSFGDLLINPVIFLPFLLVSGMIIRALLRVEHDSSARALLQRLARVKRSKLVNLRRAALGLAGLGFVGILLSSSLSFAFPWLAGGWPPSCSWFLFFVGFITALSTTGALSEDAHANEDG